MKRSEKVDRQILLCQIIEISKSLLENPSFLSAEDWETDTLLIQCKDFLNRQQLKKHENIT